MSSQPFPTPPQTERLTDQVRPQPKSTGHLFWSFTILALQGFGGVLAVVQRELVERRQWLTREEFVEDWAVAQVLPGPNVVNLSLIIGDRYFGFPGAMAALAGMLVLPCLAVLTIAALFAGVADSSLAQGALRGMGAVSAGLIAASGLRLFGALRSNVMGPAFCWAMCALTFAAVAVLHLPLAWVLLGLGVPSCTWAYWKLRQSASLNKPGKS